MTLHKIDAKIDPGTVADDDSLRSQYMQNLIAEATSDSQVESPPALPRLLIQFWDDVGALPADVKKCLDSWASLEQVGVKRLLFDDRSAAAYIDEHFTARHLAAFKRCNHPAMRADYFRLCFMLRTGGLYVDADDEFQGGEVNLLLRGSRLKLQPLCYDRRVDEMGDPAQLARSVDPASCIFYVNNNPLAAPPGHPVIMKALERATTSLLTKDSGDRDIQSLTGPGNLTACLVAHAIELEAMNESHDFEFLMDWEATAISKWPLDYRSDQRDWRRWIRGDESSSGSIG